MIADSDHPCSLSHMYLSAREMSRPQRLQNWENNEKDFWYVLLTAAIMWNVFKLDTILWLKTRWETIILFFFSIGCSNFRQFM